MNKIIWLIGIVVVIGGIWLFLGNNQGPQETGPITIGFIAPLTGDAATIGSAAQSGLELAIDEINNQGGIDGRQVNAIYEDGKCGASASGAASKLMSVDKVPVIIGGLCSGETASFAAQAMQNKVLVITPCSSAPNLSKTGKYFFRVYPSDAFQGKFAAEYAYNMLVARKIAVLYHESEWGTGIKEVFIKRFEELGGQIVFEEGTPQTARDYRTQLTKIKSAQPDYIYTPTYTEGATVLLKQAKEMGIKTKFLGGDAWGDPKLQKDVSGLGDILYIEAKVKDSDEFKSKLIAKTGGDSAPTCSPQSYDAAYILKAAIEKAGGISGPDKLADTLRATKYEGVSGHIEFDQNGDLTSANYVVKRIANGTATLVQ